MIATSSGAAGPMHEGQDQSWPCTTPTPSARIGRRAPGPSGTRRRRRSCFLACWSRIDCLPPTRRGSVRAQRARPRRRRTVRRRATRRLAPHPRRRQGANSLTSRCRRSAAAKPPLRARAAAATRHRPSARTACRRAPLMLQAGFVSEISHFALSQEITVKFV